MSKRKHRGNKIRRKRTDSKRPKWSELSHSIHFRCTEEEYFAIAERAERAGMSITRYMLAVGAEDTVLFFNGEPIEKLCHKIAAELNSQGRNYNQVVHQINIAMLYSP
ncbi:MAG: hypothetical protein FWD93_06445, partial [Coriobacteriia bacterium]|nr:hypothetical protein [Coriobacteriia bacterium]